jgi:hypothetical protein
MAADPKLRALVRRLAAPRSRPVVHLKTWDPEPAEYNGPHEAPKSVDRKVHPWNRAASAAFRAKHR